MESLPRQVKLCLRMTLQFNGMTAVCTPLLLLFPRKAYHTTIRYKEDMAIDKEDINANTNLLLELTSSHGTLTKLCGLP